MSCSYWLLHGIGDDDDDDEQVRTLFYCFLV
jgi:hypothetical protein